ncbi:MAG: hypothetical protein M1838_002480 [Thelocarpon superellum]|nr:MAG: hypothetical protein M1838_002480 [Thelocarpon superellum]
MAKNRRARARGAVKAEATIPTTPVSVLPAGPTAVTLGSDQIELPGADRATAIHSVTAAEVSTVDSAGKNNFAPDGQWDSSSVPFPTWPNVPASASQPRANTDPPAQIKQRVTAGSSVKFKSWAKTQSAAKSESHESFSSLSISSTGSQMKGHWRNNRHTSNRSSGTATSNALITPPSLYTATPPFKHAWATIAAGGRSECTVAPGHAQHVAFNTVGVVPVKKVGDLAFPHDHFPRLGAAAIATQAWAPTDTSAIDEVYAQIVRDQQAGLNCANQRLGWEAERREMDAKQRKADKDQQARHEKALRVQQKLGAENKRQFALPTEIIIEILVSLDRRSRNSLVMSCKDIWTALGRTTTTWNMSTGDFGGAETLEVTRLPQASARASTGPITRHANTIVVEATMAETKGYMHHELHTLKMMTLSCYNVADQIRHLEFHRVSLLTARLVDHLVPQMPNLEYLGIFNCDLLDAADTIDLLATIRCGKRALPVQLDFAPQTSTGIKQVEMFVAVPALMYEILPQAKAQSARLTAPGTAFLQFLRTYVSEPMQAKIEANVQDRAIIDEIAAQKHRRPIYAVDRHSNDARTFECQTGDHEMAGCFFASNQLARGAEDAECWGCRLKADLREIKEDEKSCLSAPANLVGRWLQSCSTLADIMDSARESNAVPLSHDKTFADENRQKQEETELARHIAKGHLKPGQTLKQLKGRHSWVKAPRGY